MKRLCSRVILALQNHLQEACQLEEELLVKTKTETNPNIMKAKKNR
jgi:hypothetical protein